MIVYKISWDSRKRSLTHEWYGTQAEAKKRRTELNKESARRPFDQIFVALQKVNVPTDKAGLITWLNERKVS